MRVARTPFLQAGALGDLTSAHRGLRASMNFYKRYMGDYARKTGHLSLAERGAYDALLDHYYSTMRPLPSDIASLCRIAKAHGEDECAAVARVADEFFFMNGDGLLHNKRADAEIAQWNAQSQVNRRAAAARWKGPK